MAEYQTAKNYADTSQSIDVGLRAHMNKVYGLMAVAMIITGAVAFAVGTTPARLGARCPRSKTLIAVAGGNR